MAPRFIDADAHVIETTDTFSYLDEADAKYTPMMLTQTWGRDQMSKDGNKRRDFWVIDNTLYPIARNVSHGDTTKEQRELKDIGSRLGHMDEMGVEAQVLYPSLFLGAKTDDPACERALIKSYHRWLAHIWKESGGRLRWVAVPPLYSDWPVVRAEMEFAKANGACGIMMVGLELEMPVADPRFYPLYEMAGELDLAICFHSGNHSMQYAKMFRREPTKFMSNRAPGLGAFHSLVMRDVPKRFPKVRWGFVEFSASWVPYVINHLELSFRRNRNEDYSGGSLLAENNFWVACQVTDDMPYILKFTGEDHLVIGTDYGHNDQATEIHAIQKLKENGSLPASAVDKILDANPRRLYGLQ
jgi:predicted TIM-barrel fold metal-dependent hydrolase